MTKLKIKVTKEILERSKNCQNSSFTDSPHTNCAIAVAVRDIFPKAYVNRSSMYFHVRDVGNLLAPTASFDRATTDFIDSFDIRTPEKRVQMPEIEFEIEIPDEIIEKINIDEIRPLLENHPNLSLIETI